MVSKHITVSELKDRFPRIYHLVKVSNEVVEARDVLHEELKWLENEYGDDPEKNRELNDRCNILFGALRVIYDQLGKERESYAVILRKVEDHHNPSLMTTIKRVFTE